MKSAILMLMLLVGCSKSTIKPDNPEANDYGNPPVNATDAIRGHWNRTLKDPSSVQVQSIGKPERATVYSAEEHPHSYDFYSDVTFTPVHGYRVCAIYNAKNSYGAYAGVKAEMFFFDAAGQFWPVTIMPKDVLTEMHRTGEYAWGSLRVATSSCP